MKSQILGQMEVVLGVLLAAALGTPNLARADWVLETIDSDGNVGGFPSLAIDVDGNPRVTYFEYTTGELRYAKRIGGAWQIEIVPTDYPSSFGGQSMALDSQGRPHIVHFADTPGMGGYVTYTHWTGSEWQSSYVTYGNATSSIALTSADEPRIAFMGHSDNGDSLWYAAPSGTSWSVEHVCGSGYGCCGYTPTLKLDGSDSPRIGWGYAGWFVYAWWGPEYPWPADWIGSNVDQYSASLALDAADQPHAVFVSGAQRVLTYARYLAGAWSLETVTTGTGARSRLALDSLDHPHIAYADSSWENVGPLKYAHRTTSSWCIQTVDDAPVGYLSIAVDPAGNPHIAYIAAGTPTGSLKYARWDPSVTIGDLNGDGCVNFGDINPFVLYQSNVEIWQEVFPFVPPANGDINGDGTYPSFRDINPFVALLAGAQ